MVCVFHCLATFPLRERGRARLTAEVLVGGVTTVVDAVALRALHDTHLVLALPLPSRAVVPRAACIVQPILTVPAVITEFPSIAALGTSWTPDLLVWTCCHYL